MRQTFMSTGTASAAAAAITTAANATMSPGPDGLPVTVEPDAWPVWLGEKQGAAAALLGPAADDIFRRWPVSRHVNSMRNDGPEQLEPVELPTAPRDEAQAGPDSA